MKAELEQHYKESVMSKIAKDFLENPELVSSADKQPEEAAERPEKDPHHLVTQIWSDATLLVYEFNRNFQWRSESSNGSPASSNGSPASSNGSHPSSNGSHPHAVNLEIEAGIMRLKAGLRPQIGFDLRLELENKRHPPQLIRTLRQMESNGSTGLLILCDTFHFTDNDGMVTITKPDGSVVPASEAARRMLEPLFNRISDAL